MNCPGHCLLYSLSPHSYRELPAAARRGRQPPPQRALGRAARPPSRPALRPGRRAHLLHRGAGARRARRLPRLRRSSSTTCSASRCAASSRPDPRTGSARTRSGIGPRRRSTARSRRGGVEATVSEGEGSFYGPKIDLHMTDSLGRSWQLGTVQLDYQMPKRFGLVYAGADNAEHTPAMIHRALLGSFERFLGVYLEHTAGELPALARARSRPASSRSRIDHRDRGGGSRGRAGGARRSRGRRRERGDDRRSASATPSSRRSPTSSSSATGRSRATTLSLRVRGRRRRPVSEPGRRRSTRLRKLLPCEPCKQERRVPHLRGRRPGGGSTENR